MTKNEKWAALLLAIVFIFFGTINLFGVGVIWGIFTGLFAGMIWFIKTTN